MGWSEQRELRETLEATPFAADQRSAIHQLALMAAAGNTEALSTVLTAIDRHRLTKRAIARQLVDPDDRLDAEQEAIIDVARSISAFRGDAHFLSWLFRVATTSALRFIERRRPVTTTPNPPELAGGGLSSVATTKAVVQSAIDHLPAHYREPVILRDIEQLSYRAIADRLDLPVNTIRSRISRGRALAARYLNNNLSGTGTW